MFSGMSLNGGATEKTVAVMRALAGSEVSSLRCIVWLERWDTS